MSLRSAAACPTLSVSTPRYRVGGGATSSPTRWRRAWRATSMATPAGCAAPPGFGTKPKPILYNVRNEYFRRRTELLHAAHDDARVALVGEVGPAPVEHHDQAVPEVDQKVDMGDEPDEPGGKSREFQL